MRKTLTVLTVLVAAGSLAACDYFKTKEDAPPAPVATVTEPTVTTAETPMTPADPAKPVETAKTTPETKTEAPATK